MLNQFAITKKINQEKLEKDIREIRAEYPTVSTEINSALALAKITIETYLSPKELAALTEKISQALIDDHHYLRHVDYQKKIKEKELLPAQHDECNILFNLLRDEENRFDEFMSSSSIQDSLSDYNAPNHLTTAFLGINQNSYIQIGEEKFYYFVYYVIKMIASAKYKLHNKNNSNNIDIDYVDLFGEKIASITEKIYTAYCQFPPKDYLATISFLCRKHSAFFKATIADHILVMGKTISIFSSEEPFIFSSQYDYMMYIVKYQKIFRSSKDFCRFYITACQEDTDMPLAIKASLIRSALLLHLADKD